MIPIPRLFIVAILPLLLTSVGCTKLEAWKISLSQAGTSNTGPAGAANDPRNLDSGIVTPYSTIDPEREVWVADYGDDADPGTLFEPKRTVRAALAIATPGTAIMVKAGRYSGELNIEELAGTASRPIWFRSADGKGAAELGAVKIAAATSIVIEGFKLSAGLSIDASPTKSSANVIVQNNLITGAVRVDLGLNIFLVANEIAGNGAVAMDINGVHNLLAADNYVHSAVGGMRLAGAMQGGLIMNNVVERVTGTALEIAGNRITVRANLLRGGQRAAVLNDCGECTLEKNDLPLVTGESEVLLIRGDSVFTLSDIKLISNCIYRPNWLSNQTGSSAGILSQNNSSQACQ